MYQDNTLQQTSKSLQTWFEAKFQTNPFALLKFFHYHKIVFPFPFGLTSIYQYLLLKPSVEHKINQNTGASYYASRPIVKNSFNLSFQLDPYLRQH